MLPFKRCAASAMSPVWRAENQMRLCPPQSGLSPSASHLGGRLSLIKQSNQSFRGAARFFPDLSADSPNLFDYRVGRGSLSFFHGGLLRHQRQRGRQNGDRQTEAPINDADVLYFIRIGEVLAIPGQQKIDGMHGRDGQMEGIASGLDRH